MLMLVSDFCVCVLLVGVGLFCSVCVKCVKNVFGLSVVICLVGVLFFIVLDGVLFVWIVIDVLCLVLVYIDSGIMWIVCCSFFMFVRLCLLFVCNCILSYVLVDGMLICSMFFGNVFC